MNRVMRLGLPHRKKNYETQLSINLMMRNEIEKKNKLTKKDLKKTNNNQKNKYQI
jgi:hypothetical protein